jgi:hypothetical protein
MPATSNSTMYVIGAVVVIVLVILAVALARRNRSVSLRQRFGPEYERTVRQTGNRTEAEKELARREDRVKRMHIEELPPGAKNRYTEEWRTVQTRFVDEPKAALGNADRLITNVMRDRGYPTDNFDQTVADLSPDHPSVLQNYRVAHDIARRSETGEVSTEDLRQAMVHYRSLFDDLIERSPERGGPS